MEGVNGTTRDSERKANLKDQVRSNGQVAEHIHRLIRSDRFHFISEKINDDLKERLASYSGLPEEYLWICPGFNRAIDNIVRAFCHPGKQVIICGPDEHELALRLENYGLEVISHLGATPFSADVDGILGLISDDTRLIYLEQPNALTGTVYSRYEIEMLLNASKNVTLLLNESFYEYFGSDAAGLAASYDNLIILRNVQVSIPENELSLNYILTGRRTMSRLEKFAVEEPPMFMKKLSGPAVLNIMSKSETQADNIHEAMIYLSVRLRSLGISCRLTPADFVIVRAINPDEVASVLNEAGLKARSLSHLPQLENYLQITVSDDAAAHGTVDLLEKMPRYYFMERPSGRQRLTLRRPTEPGAEQIETSQGNLTVQNR